MDVSKAYQFFLNYAFVISVPLCVHPVFPGSLFIENYSLAFIFSIPFYISLLFDADADDVTKLYEIAAKIYINTKKMSQIIGIRLIFFTLSQVDHFLCLP